MMPGSKIIRFLSQQMRHMIFCYNQTRTKIEHSYYYKYVHKTVFNQIHGKFVQAIIPNENTIHFQCCLFSIQLMMDPPPQVQLEPEEALDHLDHTDLTIYTSRAYTLILQTWSVMSSAFILKTSKTGKLPVFWRLA